MLFHVALFPRPSDAGLAAVASNNVVTINKVRHISSNLLSLQTVISIIKQIMVLIFNML